MSEKKYKFDPKTLEYRELSKKQKIIKLIISTFVSTVVVAVLLYIALAYVVETPKQRMLKKENEKLEEQYEYLISKYEQTEEVLEELKKRDANIYRAIFEAEPPSENGNYISFTQFDTLSDKQLIKLNSTTINKIYSEAKKNKKYYKELQYIFQKKKEAMRYIPAIQPISNSDLKKVIYGFGNRIDPVYKTPSHHAGIDFAAPKGTQVFATADGVVTRADDKVRGLGNHIVIKHGDDFETMYAHLSEIEVRRRQEVKRGELIGYVGNTGKSLVSHLHYEVRYQGEAINPIHFFFLELTPEQYSKVIKASSRSGISLD